MIQFFTEVLIRDPDFNSGPKFNFFLRNGQYFFRPAISKYLFFLYYFWSTLQIKVCMTVKKQTLPNKNLHKIFTPKQIINKIMANKKINTKVECFPFRNKFFRFKKIREKFRENFI